MSEATYLIKVKINQTTKGLNSIKGFLAISADEEYDASIPRHLESTVAWVCWDQMLDNIIRVNENNVDLAIKLTQRDYKLRQGKTIMYMRKHADDDEVSRFIEQVDSFIKAKLLRENF